MDRTGTLAAEFRRECEEDYVGLWEISRAVESGRTLAEHVERIIDVVRVMLDDERIAIGQFVNGEFIEWTISSIDDAVDRLRDELTALGREPDIGDVAGWLNGADGLILMKTRRSRPRDRGRLRLILILR